MRIYVVRDINFARLWRLHSMQPK